MRKFTFDCSKYRSIADFHKDFSEIDDVPTYYGRNLSALWDVITTDLPGEIEFELKNHEAFKNADSDDFKFLVEVFEKARIETHNEIRLILS